MKTGNPGFFCILYPLLTIILFASVAVAGVTEVYPPGKNLKQAIADANPHDTLMVQGGNYDIDLIEIDRPLVLIGVEYPVLDSQGGDEIIIVTSDSVTVFGFQLQNIGVSFTKDRSAIRLNRVSHVTVEKNIILNTFFGIYLQYSTDCILKNNTITGSATDEIRAGNAIHIWKGSRILVTGNTLTHHRDGIYFEFVDNSLISGNTSENNFRYGLHFMFSNNDGYEDNVFRHNGAGVAVMFSKKIEMTDNLFEENWGGASYGLLLKEISDGKLRGNTFHRNTIGIYAEGANRIEIRNCRFVANGQAMDIKGNCLDNDVIGNDFIANTFEVITNTKQNTNFFDGNYWSQYRGYDLNRDGIGDIPHRPVNLFALITQNIPAASMLLHSFLINSLDAAERIFPQLIPEHLVDDNPSMKPVVDHD